MVLDEYDAYQSRSPLIYEVMVRTFHDRNGDGHGDFAGLMTKLDYLRWLNVTHLWLTPFYDSPLLDGGYDVRDYRKIRREFGTMAEFQHLVQKAHTKGIKVIVDMVLNHTSHEHEWFQRSRDPTSEYRDFYVWGEPRYHGMPIIFPHFEESNWEFDPVRQESFLHRFFRFQPDLNYENPRVQAEMLDVVRFWMAKGVDGFRLDAVPYLFEEEGTSGAHLPRTHDFMKELRSCVGDRMLLAEANGTAAEVGAYLGGDEATAALNFPFMTAAWAALATGQRRYLDEQVLPEISENAHWANFLRNHDELTLEIEGPATDAIREAFANAAANPHTIMRGEPGKPARGVLRRLGPLLNGDPNAIMLAKHLLLTAPGIPTIYYGDEIGLGDLTGQPDRDAMRAPMPWAHRKNGGFSKAAKRRLPLPLVGGPDGHCHRNVRLQYESSGSLLRRVQRMTSKRAGRPDIFAHGEFRRARADSQRVYAHILAAKNSPESMVFLANLSNRWRFATVEIGALGVPGEPEFFTSGLQASPIVRHGGQPGGTVNVSLPPYGTVWLPMRQERQTHWFGTPARP